MGHYVRVLTTSPERIPLSQLLDSLHEYKDRAEIAVEGGTPDEWEQLILRHNNGDEIAEIERDSVDDDLGKEELEEFRDELADCQPSSAAAWLISYFDQVRCIYALRILSSVDEGDGWEILGKVQDAIWRFAPAIIQADAEGFTNEDGFHILWQFNDSVDEPWNMAVLRDGNWERFEMNLGDPIQRAAFQRGEVPPGAKPIADGWNV